MKQYEERKSQRAKDEAKAKEAAAKGTPPEPPAKAEMADGMMMGVKPGAGTKDDKAKLLPPTPWGRYVKVLLSSSEFLFID